MFINRRTRIECRRFCFAFLIFLLTLSRNGWSQEARVVWLFHSEVSTAARPLHDNLEAGIRESLQGSGLVLRVVRVDTPGWRDALERERPAAIIAVEREALDQARRVLDANRIIAAGVELPIGEGSGVHGISTVASPAHVFRTLRRVSPATERVHVVGEKSRREWWGPLAERAAREAGVDLTLHDASAIGEAAAHFLNVLRYGNPKRDALWLLDGTNYVTRDGTLPRIIEESWARHFVVYSSVLEHVRLGALFGVFPQPRELGRGLGQMARRAVNNPRGRPTVVFMDQVGEAINLRVASHLRIELGPERREFEILLGSD